MDFGVVIHHSTMGDGDLFFFFFLFFPLLSSGCFGGEFADSICNMQFYSMIPARICRLENVYFLLSSLLMGFHVYYDGTGIGCEAVESMIFSL